MAKYDPSMFIMGAVSIIIGLILLPLVAGFVVGAKLDVNVSSIPGLGAVLDMVAYSFAFGLVGLGISLIYIGYKKGKGA